ncbi:MAG: LLM class flavin-dependent oxidoreductase [Acidimicrobiales bacterium]
MQVIGKALRFDPAGEARRAEDLGFDGVRVIDHFMSGVPPEPPAAVPHPFVSLGAAAAATSQVLLTQTMVAAPIRHPFEVAQAVSSLDRISGGRAELGMGTGWLESEFDNTGLRLGPPRERIDRLIEAATICHEMFHRQGCVEFHGDHFRAVSTAEWPTTPHVPEIMLGGHGPNMLRRAAAVADRIDLLEAMSASGPRFDGDHLNDVVNLRRRMALADEAAERSGKPIAFSATVNMVVRDSPATRLAEARSLASIANCDSSAFDSELLRMVATESDALERFAVLAELGIDRLHIRPVDEQTREWLEGSLADLRAL